ncbi:unnamed protein product [Ascophyllum nodosum]
MQSGIVFDAATFAVVMIIFVTLLYSQIDGKPAPPSAGKDAAGMDSRLRSDSLDSFTVAETPAWLTVTARRVLRQISGEVTLTPRKPVASTRVLGESKEAFVAAPPWARIAYLIMTSGLEELHKTKRLIKAIYDTKKFYLVHLDRKSDASIRANLEDFISTWDDVRMLEPAVDVSWGGYTLTLTAIFGLSKMVQSSDDWDYFINLSASDFPLLPQAELKDVLGRYADAGLSFVEGAPLNERNRVEVMIDDQGLYREKQARTTNAGRPLKVGRPRLPPSESMFTVFKREFWIILHRSFCEYIEASPDNVGRSLQVYFSRFRISDESYFHTVLCHPPAPSFPVYSDNLRFVSCPPVSEGHYVLHPDPITRDNVDEAIQSGALFARKFDTEVSKGAYVILKKSLSLADPDRLGRAVNRLVTAADVGGREKFRAIPEGYSIQEVLSRPTKVAMPMLLHKERARIHPQRLELLAEDTGPSNVQPRETRAGKERGK